MSAMSITNILVLGYGCNDRQAHVHRRPRLFLGCIDNTQELLIIRISPEPTGSRLFRRHILISPMRREQDIQSSQGHVSETTGDLSS